MIIEKKNSGMGSGDGIIREVDWQQTLALGIGMEGFYGDFMPSRKQYNPGYQVGTDYIKEYSH